MLPAPVPLTIDGEVAGTGTASALLDGPIGAVGSLFECTARGPPLAAGQWLPTGALTGVHPAWSGAKVEARFDTAQRIECPIGIA